MKGPSREEGVGSAAAARALAGLPLEPGEVTYLEEIAGPAREAVAALYAIEGIRYEEPAVVFRLERAPS
jgi:hypothetical protein